MELVAHISSFLASKKIDLRKKRILLAVSGGVDSVVLAHLFFKLNLNFEIAHCNFKLRGEDAEKDAEFVKKLAETLGVKFHYTEFETKNESESRKKGIQETARTLRYDWFKALLVTDKFDYLLTAHTADDQVETILFNFVKGTGIKGLRGMLAKNDLHIRPLLSTKKKDLIAFAKQEKLDWREDASNEKTDYARNKIRVEIIPLLTEINPNFAATIIR